MECIFYIKNLTSHLFLYACIVCKNIYIKISNESKEDK